MLRSAIRKFLRLLYWRIRDRLNLPAQNDREILHRLKHPGRRLGPDQCGGIFDFPWGSMNCSNFGQMHAQFEEIFVRHQYAFETANPKPVIVDCGGNVGLSAIWFKRTYPNCILTVYEADPNLAALLRSNLTVAKIEDVDVRVQAVWVETGKVAFSQKGDDSGRIVSDGAAFVEAIDLSAHLPGEVDLLKMDIEGAEFEVVKRLCQTQTIRRVKRMVCELHLWRDKQDAFIEILALLRENKMAFSLNSVITPWLGEAEETAPFEVIGRQQGLAELYAWREC